MRHRSTYGWRAKLGLITPPTNTVNESEWRLMAPEGVSFHTQRAPLHAPGDHESDAEAVAAVAQGLAPALEMLTPARLDLIAYACTAGSMTHPAEALPQAITRRCGVAATTTAAAILRALGALGARRISVATPYHAALNAHEVAFLRAHGIEVARILGLGIGANGPSDYPLIGETPLQAVRAHALEAFVPGSDALLITCTDFPSAPLIDALETAIGAPVVTSNQATLWAALRLAGIGDAVPGFGGLFERG